MPVTQSPNGGAHRSLSQLPLLPIECLLLIARYSENESLHNFRLVSKAFQRLADPVLWRSVRLVPNIDCLQSFLALLRTSSVAPHIRTFFYDTSWQTLVSEIKFKHDSGSSLPGGESIDSTLLAKCIDGDVKSVEASGVELCLLTQILNALPNVCNLQLFMRNLPRRDHRRNPPPYYRSLCSNGGLSLPDPLLSFRPILPLIPVPHVRSILIAVYANPVKIECLGLDDLPWSALFQESSSILDPSCSRPIDFKYRQQVFSSVKTLRLTFRNQPSRDLDQHLRPLREVFRGCHDLARLYIRFNEQVETRYSPNYRMFSYLAPFVEGQSMRPLIPKLSELHIDSCLCTQSELLHFLIMHSSTLRVLCLSNISLLQSDGGESRACWVHVIKSLRHTLRLTRITFRGWLSNGGRQRWFVHQDRSVHPSRLRPQIEDFVTKKSDIMPPILSAVALKPGQDDLPRPSSGYEIEGDWSWTMTYSFRSKYDRRDPLYSGYDLFSNDARMPKALLDPWDEWFSPGPTQSGPGAALQQTPPKEKGQGHVSSALADWSLSPLGLPPPLPAKNPLTSQKALPPPLPPYSSHWPVLGNSDSTHAAATSSPPAFHMTFPGTSNANKSNSMHSTSSYLPYTEDDATIGDFSAYHSPSQQPSPSQTIPSYTPSHSSHGSLSTSDTLPSWPHSLPPINPFDLSATSGDGNNVSTAVSPPSNALSQSSSFTHPAPMDMGHMWLDPWNCVPPTAPPPLPPNDPASHTTSQAPTANMPPGHIPKSHFTLELQPSSISGQHSSLSIPQPFSINDTISLLKQKPPKTPQTQPSSLGLQQSSSCPDIDASKSPFTCSFAPVSQGIDGIFANAAIVPPKFADPDVKKKEGADLCNAGIW